MYYVYILSSQKDKKFYVGFTGNLRKRYKQHSEGEVKSTRNRRPMDLIYYEGYILESDARRNEKYYKTSKGRADLKKKLKNILGP